MEDDSVLMCVIKGLEGELLKNSPTLGRDARYQKTVSFFSCLLVWLAFTILLTTHFINQLFFVVLRKLTRLFVCCCFLEQNKAPPSLFNSPNGALFL